MLHHKESLEKPQYNMAALPISRHLPPHIKQKFSDLPVSNNFEKVQTMYRQFHTTKPNHLASLAKWLSVPLQIE